MNENKLVKQNLVVVENRNSLKITGVEKVKSFSETLISLDAMSQSMIITGEQMHAQKLDVSDGELIVMGLITQIKWETKKERIPFFKRIFK